MANVEALKDAGNRHFKNEDFYKAIDYYKEGLTLDPGNPTINCNLAQAYLAVEEFADAEVHAVLTLAQQTDSVKGFYRAAKAAYGMAKKERALSYLRTGILNCPKAEELKILYEEVNKDNNGAASVKCTNGLFSESEEVKERKNTTGTSDLKKRINDSDNGRESQGNEIKLRSRSTSGRNRSRSRNPAGEGCKRSISVSFSSSENPKIMEVSGPEDESKNNIIKGNLFLETLLNIRSELSPEEKSPQQKEREALMEKQKKLQNCMKEGSEALLIGLSKQASEKYKCALDLMADCNIEIFGFEEVNRIVLKYSLSICWIETLKYNNIIQSIGYLTEIEMNHAEELPAVYFGLGSAFYRLNRFKVALDHLDKGLKIVENCSDLSPHRWPGTLKRIAETTKMGLKESICKLQYECKIYREPDEICRYEKCLTVSTHICPSDKIFYSDPDFVGYVVIICQESCKITYHIGCWKHFKDNLSLVHKLTDKDVLGESCLTSDCKCETKEVSVIVRIEVYGEDGEVKTSCSKEPSKTDNVNEHRKERKKKNEKIDKPIKIKTTRTKVKKVTSKSENSVKKLKRKTTISSEEFGANKQKLSDLRAIGFGINETNNWNPQLDYFGRSDILNMKTYLTHNSKDSDTLRERKDFLFTFFYEYLNDEGPQKTSTIEQKWHEEVSQFPGINEFMSQHDGICDFLLQSYRFACVDDYLCLADQLSDTYQRVQAETGESIAFILTHSNSPLENNTENNFHEDKYTSISLKTTRPITPDFQISHDSKPESSSEPCSSDIWWPKRDSECDSYVFQEEEESESSSEDDSYFDEIVILTDSESEYCFAEPTETSESDNKANLVNVPESSSRATLVPQQVDLCRTPVAHCSSDANSSFLELQGDDLQSYIPEVTVPSVEEPNNKTMVVKCDAVAQTDSFNDFKMKAEALSMKNLQLIKESDEKQKLILNQQKEINDYKQQIQMFKSQISNFIIEKEKLENDFNLQKGIGESKLEAIMKKHKEQIDKLSKKKEEDASLLKKNIKSMTELNKELDKQTNAVTRLEGQLRKSNEQILNVRKQFGEFKLGSYLEKCQERIQSMSTAVEFFRDASTPSVDEMKSAIESWECVARDLQDTRKLLQVQYEILSQQVKSKVSSDCLLQLELAELPAEPAYPLQDMMWVLHLALEHVQRKDPPSGSVNINEKDASRHSFCTDTRASASPPPLLGMPPLQVPVSLFGKMTTNPFRFTSPFYSNNFNAYSKANPQNGFLPGARSSNQNLASLSSDVLSCGLQRSVSPYDKPDHSETGNRSGDNMSNIETAASAPINITKDANSSLNGETNFHIDSKKVPSLIDGSSIQPNGKQRDVLGDLKPNNSSVSGLIPIEITRNGSSEVKGNPLPSLKTVISEMKQIGPSRKRWDYPKLFNEMQKHFKLFPEVELSECLLIVREKNGNKLSGVRVSDIIRRVEKVLDERSSKKAGNMGMDKFGGAAWGEVKDNNVNWQNDDENECIICHINIENYNKTSLNCKHTFHTECIRKWLHTNSTCPICRKYTRLVDEFPPLV